jgi:hypothetical protein
MLRRFRSPRLAWLALMAFLIAQPALGCALQCLDNHHGHHEGGTSATGPVACHTHVRPAINHGVTQRLSYMEPADEPDPVRHIGAPVQVPAAGPTVPAHIFPSLDPPPPRLV